jgi:hypothetical protein
LMDLANSATALSAQNVRKTSLKVGTGGGV